MSEDVYHLKDYESEGKDKPVGTIDMSDYILLQHFESLVTSWAAFYSKQGGYQRENTSILCEDGIYVTCMALHSVLGGYGRSF